MRLKMYRSAHNIFLATHKADIPLCVCLCLADHLKLHFPMCWAAANLAWGFIEFQDVRSRICVMKQ